MIFEEKKITLKDGRSAVLKTPETGDAEKMLAFIRQACGETEFLARYPEEWNITVLQEEKWVERLRNAPDTLAIACFVDGEAAGNCEISFNGSIKSAHRAAIAIAVRRDYWNLGIGSAMFEEMDAEAARRRIEFMELSFVEGNTRARHLYEKFGFREVCVRPRAFRLKDGSHRNEIYMQKDVCPV